MRNITTAYQLKTISKDLIEPVINKMDVQDFINGCSILKADFGVHVSYTKNTSTILLLEYMVEEFKDDLGSMVRRLHSLTEDELKDAYVLMTGNRVHVNYDMEDLRYIIFPWYSRTNPETSFVDEVTNKLLNILVY
jgi:hypothetical protein